MTVKAIPSKVLISKGTNSSTQVLREENSRLKTDISRLRIEKAQLREENTRLKKENMQLNAENSRLMEDFILVQEELQEERDISEWKAIEIANSDALYHILQNEHLRLHFD